VKCGVLRVYHCKNRNPEQVFLTGVVLWDLNIGFVLIFPALSVKPVKLDITISEIKYIADSQFGVIVLF